MAAITGVKVTEFSFKECFLIKDDYLTVAFSLDNDTSHPTFVPVNKFFFLQKRSCFTRCIYL